MDANSTIAFAIVAIMRVPFFKPDFGIALLRLSINLVETKVAL